MFQQAKKSIRIVGGDLNADFYSDPKVVSALEGRVAKNVSVEIAYHPSDKKHKRAAVFGVDGVVFHELRQRPARHLMCVDGIHARIERTHEPGANRTPSVLLFNAKDVAKGIEAEFEKLVGRFPTAPQA